MDENKKSFCCNAPIKIESRYGGRELRAYCSICNTWQDKPPEKPVNEEGKTKSLNKYVIKADTEKDEWTFSGDIWKAIETLLLSQKAELREKIEGMNPKDLITPIEYRGYRKAKQDIIDLIK